MLPSSQRCARLDQLLDQALDLGDAARAAFMDSVRLEEPDLHDALLELLQLAATTAPALDPERFDLLRLCGLHGDSHVQRGPAPGDCVGAWRVVRELGRGGMGNVYEVMRADGAYEQQAALKLIAENVDSQQFLQRFKQERQILASLNHPAIARLLDGGEDAWQRPYLVMEYVGGQRIDLYCERHRLSLSARLQLFMQVASAVEYAHQQRVVHRDLKPSNIAVTHSGEVKLLDFGIAKVLGGSDTEELSAQRTATGLFTPHYATPEQVLGHTVDHRSDVYQLGVLLYELLTGQRPQQPDDGTPAALLRAVCVEAAPLPSVCAAASPPGESIKVAGLSPASLARALKGDLDLIVSKALRKEPARRYPSVAAFSDDVSRWQRGLPIRARPETCSYRIGKFVRRHPWGMAGAVSVFLFLIAYAVTVSLQARAIAEQRDRANAQARKAQQVKTLMLSMFAGANPEQASNQDLTAKQLLDSGWPLIEAELTGQPELQVEMLNTIGESYLQLGLYPRANELLARAMHLIETHPRLPPPLQAASWRVLGQILTARGRYDEAQAALRRAQTLFQQHVGENSPQFAATLRDRGELNSQAGHYADAESLFRRALAIHRLLYGEHHREVADSLSRLGMSLCQHSDYRGAEPLLRKALALHEELLPAGHPMVAETQYNLATVLMNLKRTDEAEKLYRRAWSIMADSRGADHPFVATIINSLALVVAGKLQYTEAERLLLDALAIRRQRLGQRHVMTAINLSDLGWLAEQKKEFATAREYYSQALQIYPQDHPWRGATLFNIGSVLQAGGDLQNAERYYRQALDHQRTQYGPDHHVVGLDLLRIGQMLHLQGRNDEADEILREAVRIYQLRFEPEDPRIASALLALGKVVAARGKPAAAYPLIEQAVHIRERAYGGNDRRTNEAAHVLAALGRLGTR